jgi:hypothetical protein
MLMYVEGVFDPKKYMIWRTSLKKKCSLMYKKVQGCIFMKIGCVIMFSYMVY